MFGDCILSLFCILFVNWRMIGNAACFVYSSHLRADDNVKSILVVCFVCCSKKVDDQLCLFVYNLHLLTTMNWFQGSISEAIITSRQRKCIFVVVVTTGDEASSQLLANLQDEQVARLFSDFVSVNFKNGSVEVQQFSQLCEYIWFSCFADAYKFRV